MNLRPGLLIVSLLLAPPRYSSAADLLGLYVGGSVGQAHLAAAEAVPDVVIDVGPGATRYSGALSVNRTGFKVMAGIRPLPFLGAEVAYDDLGRSTGHYSNFFGGNQAENEATLSMRGESAFGVLYLPISPLDLFAKAGLAVIKSELIADTYLVPACPPDAFCPAFIGGTSVNVDRTSATFAAGAGAQVRLGSFAIRGEYEYFTAAGAHPSLLTVGAIWSF